MIHLYKRYAGKEIGLKQCPYCGNEDISLIDDDFCWFVWCNRYSCNRETINCFATKEEAIEDWEKEYENANKK